MNFVKPRCTENANLCRGTKVCSNGPGHMTKMVTRPIYQSQVLLLIHIFKLSSTAIALIGAMFHMELSWVGNEKLFRLSQSRDRNGRYSH